MPYLRQLLLIKPFIQKLDVSERQNYQLHSQDGLILGRSFFLKTILKTH